MNKSKSATIVGSYTPWYNDTLILRKRQDLQWDAPKTTLFSFFGDGVYPKKEKERHKVVILVKIARYSNRFHWVSLLSYPPQNRAGKVYVSMGANALARKPTRQFEQPFKL